MIEIDKLLQVLKGLGTDEKPLTIGLLKIILKEYKDSDRREALRNRELNSRQL